MTYHSAETVVAVSTTGSAGSATGSADSPVIYGYLDNIFIDYHGSCPATADVTISFKDRGGNILVVSNNATDGLYVPAKQACDAAGAAISGVYASLLLNQALTVSVAQADALTNCVTVYIRYLIL